MKRKRQYGLRLTFVGVDVTVTLSFVSSRIRWAEDKERNKSKYLYLRLAWNSVGVKLIYNCPVAFTSVFSMLRAVFSILFMVARVLWCTLSVSSVSLTISFQVQGITAPPPSLLCKAHFCDIGGFLLAVGFPSMIL